VLLFVRSIVLFVLGVLVIVKAIVNPTHPVAEYVLGMVLVSLVPVSDLLDRVGFNRRLFRHRDEDDDEDK